MIKARQFLFRKPLLSVFVLLASAGCSKMTNQVFLTNGSKAKSLESQLALAMLSEKHDDKNRAQELYRKLLVSDPKNVQSRHRLAIIASRQENFDEATRLFKECIELDPNNAELLNDFGYAAYLANDQQNAEQHLLAAVKIRPDFPAAWTNLGLLYGQQSRFEDCRNAFMKATESPEKVHCNMGFVYGQAMQLEQATSEFSRALSINPDCVAAAEGLIQVCKQTPGKEPKTVVSTFGRSMTSESVGPNKPSMTEPTLVGLQSPNPGIISPYSPNDNSEAKQGN
jgi:Tfp pilus assembly protein PilF